jgi:hypothetical protein
VHEEDDAVVVPHCTETLSLTLVLVRLLSHAGTGDSHSPRNSSGAVVVFGALLLLYHYLRASGHPSCTASGVPSLFLSPDFTLDVVLTDFR